MIEIEKNELNRNANGGTELVTRGLFQRVDPRLMENVQLISSRVRDLDPNKKHVLHLHDLAQDPESQHLKHPESVARFDALVFCSNWQYQQYQNVLGLPWGNGFVIPNGIEPIRRTVKESPGDKIRLIYTSTPQRGLAILVPVFEELYKEYGDLIELDVFSSFKIYGWPERDRAYTQLFERCSNHPGINYHGFQLNETVRTHLQKAHIFAYPSIWQETFCIALAEAMSAGCVCVHSDLGALPETSGGFTKMYNGTADLNQHGYIFYFMLKDAINRLISGDTTTDYTDVVKEYADMRYSWNAVLPRWNYLLSSLQAKV